jgi:hypothetical protein
LDQDAASLAARGENVETPGNGPPLLVAAFPNYPSMTGYARMPGRRASGAEDRHHLEGRHDLLEHLDGAGPGRDSAIADKRHRLVLPFGV